IFIFLQSQIIFSINSYNPKHNNKNTKNKQALYFHIIINKIKLINNLIVSTCKNKLQVLKNINSEISINYMFMELAIALIAGIVTGTLTGLCCHKSQIFQ